MTHSIVDSAKTDPFNVFASLVLTGVPSIGNLGFLKYLFDTYSTGSTDMARPKSHTVGVTAKVMDYFKQRPGQTVNIFEICRETGLDKDRVQYSINRLKITKTLNIEAITRGQVFRYVPETEEVKGATVTALPHIEVTDERVAKMVFEYVGRTKQENIIVRDLDQNLFILTPLDV